jgi:F-type H+-transporting ATPase subunit b
MQLPDLSLLLVMAIFWATYAVLRMFVFTPLGAILKERDDKTASATAALASTLEREKDTLATIDRRLTEARREALSSRHAMRAVAATKRQELLDAAREKARLAAAEAQAKLEGEIEAARAELSGNARAAAVEIASHALGRRLA